MLKIYKASAGSGKTFKLTEEYLSLLFAAQKKKQHRNILAVTFTNKATEEMKSRILEELFLLSTDKESKHKAKLKEKFQLSDTEVQAKAKELLIEIVHDYSSFFISTIDSFFQRVIRAFAREIGVNGGYSLELNNDQILEQSVDNMFFELDEAENQQLLEWMTRYAEELIDDSKSWNFKRSLLKLGKEIFKESYQDKATETSEKLHDKEFLKAYRRSLLTVIAKFESETKKIAHDALEILETYGLETTDFSGSSRSSMKILERIEDGNFKLTLSFRRMAEDVTNCYAKSASAEIKENIVSAYHNGLQEKLVELINYIDTEFYKSNSAMIILRHLNTLGILSDLAMQIKKLTTEQNSMLISDSNLLLNKIIDGSDTPFVYEKTAMHLENIMIDEFQDTSVLQWNNFRPLLAESLAHSNPNQPEGNLNLVVGDVKQSIYRWRNSDWKLLAYQIGEDFVHHPQQSKTLDTNWRSDRCIVEFNNAFFKVASNELQLLLNEKLEEALGHMPQLSHLQNVINHAYEDTEQKVSARAGEGKVKIQFIDQAEIEDSWKNESLNRLPGILENLQDRGYKPSDVAILVRKNDHEAEIVNKLLQHKGSEEAKEGYSYDLVSNEGLKIESARSVQFLLGILRLFIKPDDEIQRMLVSFEYAYNVIKKTENEAVILSHQGLDDWEVLSPLFTDEENAALEELKQYSLFEMTEKLIALFDLASWHNEAPFIQSFQDVVFEFSMEKSSDINSFLQWWDKFAYKQYIAAPDNENAFRIMTIHKSKGLAFDVVVMPFCDWDLTPYREHTMWVQTQEAPFDELPLMPVTYTGTLANSVFSEAYFTEMMHAYIDNLNLAYVAFTRPRHELIVFCPFYHPNKDGSITVNKFAKLAKACVENTSYNYLYDGYDGDKLLFERGEFAERQTEIGEDKQPQSHKFNQYPISDLDGRLKLKHSIGLFNREEVDITETPLDYGNMMHEIFCRIESPEDHLRIIENFIREGRLKPEEADKISADIQAFWEMPEVDKWFKEEAQALNETTILTPEGYHYRPDRIILEGRKHNY